MNQSAIDPVSGSRVYKLWRKMDHLSEGLRCAVSGLTETLVIYIAVFLLGGPSVVVKGPMRVRI